MKRLVSVATLGLALCVAANATAKPAWDWRDTTDTTAGDTHRCQFPVKVFGGGGRLGFTPGKGWIFVSSTHPNGIAAFSRWWRRPGKPELHRCPAVLPGVVQNLLPLSRGLAGHRRRQPCRRHPSLRVSGDTRRWRTAGIHPRQGMDLRQHDAPGRVRGFRSG